MGPINIAIDIANLSKLFLALIDGMTEEQKETTPAPIVVVPQQWHDEAERIIDQNGGAEEGATELTVAGCATVVGDVDSVMLVMADGITYDARRFTGDLDSALINTIAH